MNINTKFEQSIAETMNEASQESAADLLDRCVEFGIALDRFIDEKGAKLPDVIIDGMLMANINCRHFRTMEFAKKLARSQHD